jgi:hypothetical protein
MTQEPDKRDPGFDKQDPRAKKRNPGADRRSPELRAWYNEEGKRDAEDGHEAALYHGHGWKA